MTLTDFVIQKKSKAGRYTDDKTKGLHLWVKPSLQKYWVFRYTFKGKRQGMGLGVYPAVTLKMAREKAIVARLAVNQGVSH